jgi:hypothetical protein
MQDNNSEANLAITDAPQCVRSEDYLRWLKYIINYPEVEW